jgi:hypothetical protein
VRCWGFGLFGALGYGSLSTVVLPSSDVDVGGDVDAIALGDFHTCALLSVRASGGVGVGDG